MADCNRDVELAAALGFRGKVLGVFPGSGGIDAAAAQTCRFPGPVCRRPAIAVKGYQNDTWGGRALVALQGIHRAADVLRRFQIHVYSATPDVARVVEHIRVTSSLDIRCLPAISHAEMLALFGRSRLAIATGTTDGTPNAMLEAMAMGACPVQSDTGSTAEWIEDGVNGRLVPPEDALAIEAAVRHAATDDAFVERAATLNLWRIRDRADRAALRPRIVDAYLRAAGANHV
jgi:glycosyltransferase involved in cell wall biosynthesis